MSDSKGSTDTTGAIVTKPAPSCRRLLVRVLRPVRRDIPVRDETDEPVAVLAFDRTAEIARPVFEEACCSASAETPNGGFPQSSQNPSTIVPVQPGR